MVATSRTNSNGKLIVVVMKTQVFEERKIYGGYFMEGNNGVDREHVMMNLVVNCVLPPNSSFNLLTLPQSHGQ